MPLPRLLAWPCVALLSLCACEGGSGPGAGGGSVPPAEKSESAPVEVRVALVERTSWERSVPALGELAPYERVVVATKVPGRLETLRVDRGDRVRAGELLASLEAREYELRVRAAEAAVRSARALLGLPLEGAEAGLDAGREEALDPESTAPVKEARANLRRVGLVRERATALAREGVDSQAMSDTAEAEYLAAEARLQEAFELVAARRATLAQRRAELEIARAQLDETRLGAPFEARVVARRSARGAYLATGAAVLELARVDPLRLVLEVSEREAGAVRVGQRVRARLADLAEELEGTVTRLAPTLSPDTRTLVLEVELPDPDGSLRPGAFAEARVVTAPSEPALGLPSACIASFAGIDKAFVVREGKAEERRLTLGRREGERVEVLAGLEEGEEVVLAPGKLGTGAAVRVVR